MKKSSLFCLFIFCIRMLTAQTITGLVQKAFNKLESDPALKHGLISLYVIDAKTGKMVFGKNAEVGLAPASCQKIFTSISALDILGADYRYKTLVGYDGKLAAGSLQGNLHIIGSGDPTFGSWRWPETREEKILQDIFSALQKKGIVKISGTVLIDDSRFPLQPIPGGWVWDDIGNYYGAGSWGINWRENQYDLVLKAGHQAGDSTQIISVVPATAASPMTNEIKTGEPNSGDNAYVYMPPYASAGFTQGTIPAGEDRFTISGAVSYGSLYFAKALEYSFREHGIQIGKPMETFLGSHTNSGDWAVLSDSLFTYYSPRLDSINYWFLKKSINLYGEVFIKTLALEKTGIGSTEKGIELVQKFWKQHGIESSAVNIIDGSGLSPQNRVTTHALVAALEYARHASWFRSFYDALPDINHMKMKSGSIGGARSFAGYQRSKAGGEYIFAIIVNNYDGSSSEIVRKMWRTLDSLK